MKTFRFFLVVILIIIIASICAAQKLPKIFWVCDTGMKSYIQSANCDGTGMFDIVSDLKTTRAIALDSVSNPKQIYFAVGDTVHILYRVNVDGTGLTEVVSNVVGINDMELDLLNRRIYWASSTWGYEMIVSADMDIQNSGVDTLYYSSYTYIDIHGIGLDNEHGKIYWAESNNGGYDRIMRMNKNGTDKELIISNSMFYLSAPRDIDVISDKIYWTDSGLFAHWIMQANLDGTDIDTVITDVSSLSIVINPFDKRIFWTQQMGFYCSPIDTMIKTFLFNGNHGSGYSIAICYDSSLISSVEEPLISNSYKLFQSYPNPFNPSTSIRYSIISRQLVQLKVYDMLGNEIATLVNEEKPAGNYEVTFNASALSSGIYFYQLKSGTYVETKKMVLLK